MPTPKGVHPTLCRRDDPGRAFDADLGFRRHPHRRRSRRRACRVERGDVPRRTEQVGPCAPNTVSRSGPAFPTACPPPLYSSGGSRPCTARGKRSLPSPTPSRSPQPQALSVGPLSVNGPAPVPLNGAKFRRRPRRRFPGFETGDVPIRYRSYRHANYRRACCTQQFRNRQRADEHRQQAPYRRPAVSAARLPSHSLCADPVADAFTPICPWPSAIAARVLFCVFQGNG